MNPFLEFFKTVIKKQDTSVIYVLTNVKTLLNVFSNFKNWTPFLNRTVNSEEERQVI